MALNNEGRMLLDLPSGRKAQLRPYDAYAADALGDMALTDEGTDLDKALSGLVESIDEVPFPTFEKDREGAIKAARDLLLNDYLFILFMAVATYRDGVFEGNVADGKGGSFYTRLALLDEDGKALKQFQPPAYPKGAEKVHEWEEDVANIGTVKFRFHLLDGHARAKLVTEGVGNLNADLTARKPVYYDNEKGMWIPYQPKARPPVWASKILSAKVREIDPVIQFTGQFPHQGRVVNATLFGIPDFFLRDFM